MSTTRRKVRFAVRQMADMNGMWVTYDLQHERPYKLHGDSRPGAEAMTKWVNTCHAPRTCFCAQCDPQHPANRSDTCT